jgi:hypothetical protein
MRINRYWGPFLVAEYVFLGIFLLEMVVKMVSSELQQTAWMIRLLLRLLLVSVHPTPHLTLQQFLYLPCATVVVHFAKLHVDGAKKSNQKGSNCWREYGVCTGGLFDFSRTDISVQGSTA